MANVVGQLVIRLQADIAEFTSDMGKANQVATQTSAQIARQVRDDTKDARGSLMLLGDDFGIHLPREIRKSLAEMEGFREVAAAAMTPVLIIGFATVLTETVIPAIQRGASALAGWGEEEKKAYDEQVKVNKELADSVKKTRDLAFENSLIGKTAEEQAQMRAQHAATEQQTAQQRLTTALANLKLIRDAEAEAAAPPVDMSALPVADLAASDFTGFAAINEAITGITKKSKELTDAENAVAVASAEVSYESEVAAGKTKELTQAQKEAADQAAQTAKQHQQDVAAALASLSSIGARVAKENGDALSEITARNDAEFLKVRAIALKYPELWGQTLDEELQIRLAKGKEIAAAMVKLRLDADKAVADAVKANEAGMLASVPLGGTPSAPGFREDPFAAQLSDLTAHTQKAAEEQGKLVDQMWLSTRTSAEQYAFELQKINLLYSDHSKDDYKRALVAINNQYDLNTIAEREFATQAGQTFQGLISGTESWKQALEGVLEQLILLIPKLLLANEIQSMMGQGGSTGFIGSVLGGLLGIPHRAGGGDVQAGMPYITSENGPELFIPSTSGTIVPNHALRGASGGSGIVIHNDFRGVDAATIAFVEQRVAQGVRTAVQQSLAKGADQQRRR